MNDLAVTIRLPPGWSLADEWAARQELENTLKSARVGTLGGVGTTTGGICLSLRVVDESAASSVIAKAVQKAMPGAYPQVRRLEELLRVRSFCPHTGIMQWHSRRDGRCAGCGKVRPELIDPGLPEFRHAIDDFLLAKAAALGDRRLREFACACCRRIWHLLTDPRSRAALDLAERYATGQAENEQLESALEAAAGAVETARSHGVGHSDPGVMAAAYAVYFAASFRRAEKDMPISYDAQHAVNAAIGAANAAAFLLAGAYDGEREAQRVILAKLLGDPTRGQG
jgi:hypothetical protein